MLDYNFIKLFPSLEDELIATLYLVTGAIEEFAKLVV